MTWINRGPLGKGNWITDEHGRQIAVTYSERINPKSVEDTAKILAAEDMLKALKWAVGLAEEAILLREESGDPDDTEEMTAAHRAELANANALIAKVEGRTNG